jgi:hypothetical protein
MESDNGCALPLKLKTQLKVNAKHDLNEGVPTIRNHVDVGMRKFKSLKGLFHMLVYSKTNHKQQTSTSDPRVIASNIGL